MLYLEELARTMFVLTINSLCTDRERERERRAIGKNSMLNSWLNIRLFLAATVEDCTHAAAMYVQCVSLDSLK